MQKIVSDRRGGGLLFQLGNGELYGMKEMLGTLKPAHTLIEKIKMKCFLSFLFWCKEYYVENADSIYEVSES